MEKKSMERRSLDLLWDGILSDVTKKKVENLCQIFESWTQVNEWGLLAMAVR